MFQMSSKCYTNISFLPSVLLHWSLHLCFCTDFLHFHICIRYDTILLPVGTNNAESGTSTCKNTVLHGDGGVDWHLDCDDLVYMTGLVQDYGFAVRFRFSTLYVQVIAYILKLHLLPLLQIHKNRLTYSILHPWLRTCTKPNN